MTIKKNASDSSDQVVDCNPEGSTTYVKAVDIDKTSYSTRLPHTHPAVVDPNSGDGRLWEIRQRFQGAWKKTAEGISWYGKMPTDWGIPKPSSGSNEIDIDEPGEERFRIFWALSDKEANAFATFQPDRERQFVQTSMKKIVDWFSSFHSVETDFTFLRGRLIPPTTWQSKGLICTLHEVLASGSQQNDYGIAPVLTSDEGMLFGVAGTTSPILSTSESAIEVWRLQNSKPVPPTFTVAPSTTSALKDGNGSLTEDQTRAASGWFRLFNAVAPSASVGVALYQLDKYSTLYKN